jgi:hypothetical protein
VLELVAVGEPLGQAELARLADLGSVETLERKGLITSWVEGRRVRVRLAHPVYGDVVGTGVSVLRERALSRSLPGPATTILSPSGWRARPSPRAPASTRASWPPRPRTSREGRPRPSASWPPWPRDAASDAAQARVALLRFDNAFLLQGRVPDLRLLDDAAGAIADLFRRDELLNRRSFVMSSSRGPRLSLPRRQQDHGGLSEVVVITSNCRPSRMAGQGACAALPVSLCGSHRSLSHG